MDCMVVICLLLQILLTQAIEGIKEYQVRFVIPPSCRSGFVLRDPEDKLILQLSSIHSSYSDGITVSNGCHDKSDPGGCVVKGTVSTLGVYWVRPNDAGNVGCYKNFNVTACREGMFQCRDDNCVEGNRKCDGTPQCEDGSDEDGCQDPSEDVNTMATNRSNNLMVTKGYSNEEINTAVTEQDKRVPDSIATTNSPDIATVTKDNHNVEVNTAVTEQGKRDTDSIATTDSPDIAMVTTGFSFAEVYTKLTERDNDNQQNSIIVVAIVAVVAVVLVAVIIAVASFVFIRKFKRKRKRRDVQPEDPPPTNNVDNKVYDPDFNSIYAEIDNCVMSDESPAYDYVTNNDLLTKPTTSADYITPAGCNDKDLKTQATTSDDYYLVPLNKRNPVYEALGDNTSDEYTTLDRQNMNMYENRKMFRKQHHF